MNENSLEIRNELNLLGAQFKLEKKDLKSIMEQFHSEMKKGLAGSPGSLQMLPAFVDIPKGNESGKFLALDLGGTNFRVLEVSLDGKGKAEMTAVSKFTLPEEKIHGTGTQLFDFIVASIQEFLDTHDQLQHTRWNLGFTFSFPLRQKSIRSGALIKWTKEFTASGVENEDVVRLLNEALERKGIDCIHIASLANDTVGTLAAKAYGDHQADMGIIFGTGTNACYREKMSNIKKASFVEPGSSHMIINIEWGNFNKLPLTRFDKALDMASEAPGRQLLEKTISGMYLGDLTAPALNEMIQKNLIFAEFRSPIPKGHFKTEHMSLVEADQSENLDQAKKLCEELGFGETNLSDRIALQKVCNMVSTRAARIGAAAIAAVITWMDPELQKTHSVGIDGTLFKKHPNFNHTIVATLTELLGADARRIQLHHVSDGSGMGVAIIAAAASHQAK